MDSLFLAAEQAFASAPAVVAPSMPILYFGDLDKYRQSPLRVVTAALNPSRVEFPAVTPFQRFPHAANWMSADSPRTRREMVQTALNRYFVTSPYRSWFDSLEHVLAGFGTSFYGHRANTALHTDLLSPVATDPTWRGLTSREQEALAIPGVKIWHGLIAELRPHIVLLSVAAEHLDRLSFRSLSPWFTSIAVPAKPQFPIKTALAETAPGMFTDFIFARAAQKPFGFFSDVEKRSIGPGLRGSLCNW